MTINQFANHKKICLMKKISIRFFAMVTMLLCASTMAFAAVDWSQYQFLGDGAGGGKYSNKYKVETVDGLSVVNIQKPDFADEAGIYMTLPTGISECSVASAIQGAGIVVYLSAFTAQETEVTIKYAPANEVTFHVYYADGGSTSVIDKPRMISASLEGVDMNNAYVRVNATDAVTSLADLKYACILTQGEHVYQFEMPATNGGILHLKDMPACSEHTLEVWAVNQDGKKSDNSIKVHFTTECDVADLWLAGSMNALSDGSWNPRDDNYQFRKTKVADVYSLTKHLKKGSYVYKLTKGSFESENCTENDRHLILSEDMDVTFYARGVNNFASSADSIFLIGTATSGFLPESAAWDCKTNGKYCKWNEEHTSAIWTGNVYGVSGDTKGEYKIVKIAYLNGTETDMPYVYWSDLWKDNQTISGVSESSTEASFIFDLPTLSWSWHEVYEGQCTFAGQAGDGQKHNSSFSPFTTGYKVSLYLNSTKDSIWITAESMDTDQTATSALMQNYPNRKEAEGVEETRLDRVGDSQVFKGKVSIASFKNRADGIIRFGIKFEYPNGGIRVTTPEFYYLDGSGCAERDFVIYHHDQIPEDPERDAAVYTFKGGRILQPIVYKRKLKPGIWETLSLPFDVSKITVSEGEVEYELHAQYNNNGTTVAGEFWLRDFREKEVSAEEFQANWHDIQATTAEAALPKKNVPYIIRVPDDDTHYWADKYIVFHGASYQIIDDVYSTDVQTPRATEMFAYSGNNTMKEWQLRSAYVLDNEGIYFESGETVTLYPFECAVNAEIETTRAMPRLALNRKPGVPTGNLPPTTAVEPGNVWSVTGWYVGSFCDSNQYDRLIQRLPAGMYVVRQAETTYKVYIAK